jgi:sugar (pentulose or hexulose) kinase
MGGPRWLVFVLTDHYRYDESHASAVQLKSHSRWEWDFHLEESQMSSILLRQEILKYSKRYCHALGRGRFLLTSRLF